MNIQTNYCNNFSEVKQLNEIMKLYYFYALKELWDSQDKIKMGCPGLKSSYREKGLLLYKFPI